MNTQIIDGHEYKLVLCKSQQLPTCFGCVFFTSSRTCGFPKENAIKRCSPSFYNKPISCLYHLYIKSWD